LDPDDPGNIFVMQFQTMKQKQFLTGSTFMVGALTLLLAFAVGATIKPVWSIRKQMKQVTSHMPPLAGATGWLNSEPLTAAGLHGKVVLVDFWTYTCINWRRTLPYINAWARKYKDRGLVVIGAHTPEFSFEHNFGNVSVAAKEMKISYPIAIDDNYAIWHAFSNEYWPALYIIDAKGRIRHHQFGEGGYQESERIIQQLLAEAGAKDLDSGLVSVDARGPEAAADWQNLQSSENYVGYERTEGFISPGGAVADQDKVYASPAKLTLNQWALSGDWTMGTEATTLNKANGRIRYCFHARNLQLVMGPSTSGMHVRFRVTIDGRIPGIDQGVDVDSQGNGQITVPRMYQLIQQKGVIVDRLFEIEFLDPWAATYSFTFG
jgi:thiol-disulfide isomerase/thioredoxin